MTIKYIQAYLTKILTKTQAGMIEFDNDMTLLLISIMLEWLNKLSEDIK